VYELKFSFDHDLHIHSYLSLCVEDTAQTNERILRYAKENNLKAVALTDHFWDRNVSIAPEWYYKQDYNHIAQALPLPKDDNVRFLFGCEADMDKDFTLGIAPQNFDKFDFVVIATTHVNNMPTFGISTADYKSPERRAELWGERLEALLNMPLPFYKIGIAHPTCTLLGFGTRESYLEVLNLITTETMKKVFKKAAKCGVGIELNRDDMKFSDEEADIILRPYRIAKKCGCKFYLGSDAHRPETFLETKEIFEHAIDLLELTEDDKFNFSKL